MTAARPCKQCGKPTIGLRCDDCLETFTRKLERKSGLPPGGRDPAEVKRDKRLRRAALLVLDCCRRSDLVGHSRAMDAAAAAGGLPALPEQALTIIRWYLRTLPGELAVFEAALAAEEHEHGFDGEPDVVAELVLNRILLLVRHTVIGEALRRLTEGVEYELMLYAGPAPDSLEGLT